MITDKNGEEFVGNYNSFGKYNDSNYACSFDLFFATEKHEGWINVYKSGISWSLGTNIWPTEEEAKEWVGTADYTTTIKIEWEE